MGYIQRSYQGSRLPASDLLVGKPHTLALLHLCQILHLQVSGVRVTQALGDNVRLGFFRKLSVIAKLFFGEFHD